MMRDASFYEWHRNQKNWRDWKNWFEPIPWYRRFYYFWAGKHYVGFHTVDVHHKILDAVRNVRG